MHAHFCAFLTRHSKSHSYCESLLPEHHAVLILELEMTPLNLLNISQYCIHIYILPIRDSSCSCASVTGVPPARTSSRSRGQESPWTSCCISFIYNEYFDCTMCNVHIAYISHSTEEACATVEVESNKEMTGLNWLNGAAARLVDISTIINHLGPMDHGGQKLCTSWAPTISGWNRVFSIKMYFMVDADTFLPTGISSLQHKSTKI